MNKLRLLLILASGVLVWYAPRYLQDKADDLSREGAATIVIVAEPARIITTEDGKRVREVDDIPPPAVIWSKNPVTGENTIELLDPVGKEKQQEALKWGNAAQAINHRWLPLVAMLLVAYLLFKRRGNEQQPVAAGAGNRGAAGGEVGGQAAATQAKEGGAPAG